MPRLNYGNAVKQRAIQFFTVLVDYANDELTCDDRQLEYLQREIKLHWQSRKRFVVRTKIRYLEDVMRLAASELSREQIKESIKYLIDFLGVIEDNRPSKGGSETWHFTFNLWHDRFDRTANLFRFDTEWEQRKLSYHRSMIDRVESIDPAHSSAINWLELVKSSLTIQQYQRITTNPLMIGEELKFSLEEVYVPLGLIERQHPTVFDLRDDQEENREIIERETIPDLEQLLVKIIDNCTPNRIAIIGEPGSGKTTCLQRLAAGLLDRELLPIWISLADLQGETLEDYLLEDWLKIATKKITIDVELKQNLAIEFERGKVWLLLDAVDEMTINGTDSKTFDASISLANLARQLRGWLGAAHIILTCRSNVWDSGKNALENFTTYHNLNFSHGYTHAQNQVTQFIQSWFRDRPDLGKNLDEELAQPQYQRLRDAIKNPLRLALLCRSWSLTQGKLPSTKSNLYQQFVDNIYTWKQERFPTTLAQRQQLNRGLGKLALQSLDRDRIHFRLPHHFILELLDPNLLELALQLGWLNRVGISATSGANIYAFYHPTFQEYFAAQAIEDWQYFFTVKDRHHLPIFSPYWQETILFWFGREDVPDQDKEVCIKALINFDKDRSNSGKLYYYRAYFLAAAAIAEFPDSIWAHEIVARLLKWRFAEFIPTQNIWQFYPLPIQDGARLALRKADRFAAIAGLVKFVNTIENPLLCWQAAHSLGKIFDPGNAIAIQALIKLLTSVKQTELAIKICDSLVKIDPNQTPIAITTLTQMIHTSQRETIRRKAAFNLGKLLLENQLIEQYQDILNLVIDTLIRTISTAIDPNNRIAALDNLRQIAPTHPTSQQHSIPERTLPSNTRNRRHKKPHERNLEIAIAELEQKLTTVKNVESQRRYAYQLGKFQPGHPLAVNALLELMSSPLAASFYKRTGEYLREILLDEQLALVITRLKEAGIAVEQGDRSPSALASYKLLWYCAEQLPYQIFVQIWEQ